MSVFALLEDAENQFDEKRVLRSAAPTFEDCSDKFRVPKRDYKSQYAGMYFMRLALLRNQVITAASEAWPDVPVIAHLKDVKPLIECVIVGTLYKVMKLKPSALKELIENELLLGEDAVRTYMDSGDNLIIEDDTARHPILPGDGLPVDSITTGMVIGCKVELQPNGHLKVLEHVFPKLPLLPSLDGKMAERSPHCIALVSGLGFGLPECNHENLLRLKDFLVSSVATDHNITRLVVVGDTVENVCSTKSLGVLESADLFFATLASTLFIDVMPGAGDPTGYCLPQQPLSPALFPVSRRFRTFRSVTNPYAFSDLNVRFVGSSGQCVRDISMYSKYANPLDALEVSLRCRCLAPGAPDTLSCYPFPLSEPFTFAKDADFPHVLFSGCHNEFGWRRSPNGSVLITVPRFSVSAVVVLVDIERDGGVFAVNPVSLG